MSKNIAIIGHGVVGSAYRALFPESLVFDINGKFHTQEQVNSQCDIALICVPTPMGQKGVCDLSAVESSVTWLQTPLIVIKSTVPAGTTEMLREKYGKTVIFNPEFLRATTAKQDLFDEKNIIIGGTQEESQPLVDSYKKAYSHDLNFYYTSPRQAELIKYMRNAFLSTKIIFLNEMKAISDSLGLNFDQMRDLWVLDERMGSSHNHVDQHGGFGGMCFPKDVNALIHFAEQAGHNPKLLKTVWNRNTEFRDEFKDSHKFDLE